MQAGLTRKWRPRLWSVVMLVLGLVLCLPFAGLFLFKFYANQLVQQTEESVLAQGAILAAVYSELYAAETGREPASTPNEPQIYSGVFPSLSMRRENILPPRPEAVPAEGDVDPVYSAIGPALSRVAVTAQIGTLAGYRLLDNQGQVIGGSAEIGQSLIHVSEVSRALQGQTVSVARERIRTTPEPVLYSFSRGTRVRVFVAMPVLVNDEVIGAVYISRTPNHIFRFLYGERFNLAKAALFVLISTALIGFVFWRFITRPIMTLIRRTQSTGANGQRWTQGSHFGTREIETLSNSFQTLTERLQNQQDGLKTYTAHVTHELKSPLTAIKGAAELMRDTNMTEAQRQRFLNNINRDAARMEDLLASMRAFSLADQTEVDGETRLDPVVDEVAPRFTPLDITTRNAAHVLPIHTDAFRIILTHMLENALQHEAKVVTLTVRSGSDDTSLIIEDDGTGISEGNLDKVLTPFFTTRRDGGGTGMGLNIVRAVVEAVGGNLTVEPCNAGARFRIEFSKDGPRNL